MPCARAVRRGAVRPGRRRAGRRRRRGDGGGGPGGAVDTGGGRRARAPGEPVTTTIAVGPPGRGGWRWVRSRSRWCSSSWRTPAGSGRLPDRAPLTASSRGLGDAIRAALDTGAREVVVGVGGSASTDGGAGALAASAPASSTTVTTSPTAEAPCRRSLRTDLSGRARLAASPRPRRRCRPARSPGEMQRSRGLRAEGCDDVALLEAALARWVVVVAAACATTSTTRSGWGPRRSPHPPTRRRLVGAAGGMGFALLAVRCRAPARGGRSVRRPRRDLGPDPRGPQGRRPPDRHRADLVVTGEGSLDPDAIAGKTVAGVARRRKARHPGRGGVRPARPRRGRAGSARRAHGIPAHRPRTGPRRCLQHAADCPAHRIPPRRRLGLATHRRVIGSSRRGRR